MNATKSPLAKRFRGYLPVVVDVETSGFDPKANALLEIAAVLLEMDGTGQLHPAETLHAHVKPFAGARLDESSLRFNGIDPFHPFRFAVDEGQALLRIFAAVENSLRRHGCSRAILVGHNPAFDIAFLTAAVTRAKISKNPFHSFTTFDTATLAGLAFGHTVLARAARAAGLGWNPADAHSAAYDARQTARLFCTIVNRWQSLMGQNGLPAFPSQ
jgi:ribonuclease T